MRARVWVGGGFVVSPSFLSNMRAMAPLGVAVLVLVSVRHWGAVSAAAVGGSDARERESNSGLSAQPGRLPKARWYSDLDARRTINTDLMLRALAKGGGALRDMPQQSAPPPDERGTASPSQGLRFSEAKKVGSGNLAPGLTGGWDCFGLVDLDCAPCPPPEQNEAGNAGGCKLLTSMCNNLFCDPLCLDTTIDCQVKGVGGQFSQANGEEVAKALCSEFKAHACSEPGCCDGSDSMVQNWVEESAYGESFPEPLMLIEACKHNPEDKGTAKKLCDDCKKAVKGKIKMKPYKKEDVCDPMDASMGDANSNGDAETGNSWTPYNREFGYPFIGPHKPVKERCEELIDKLEGSLPGVQAEAEEAACHCLGCCDPHSKCFFPIVENPDDSLGEPIHE